MKKQAVRLAFGVCFTMMLAMAAGTPAAFAQDTQGKYITEATVRLIKLMDAANKEGFLLQANSFSIGGGWLIQSQTEWVSLYTVQLDAGKSYRFLAAGDGDTRDLDLKVTDLKGNVAAIDEGADPEAIVNFVPKEDGRYVVSLRLYDSASVNGKKQPCLCLGVVTVKK